MGISFFERMSGVLTEPCGSSHPIEFEIKAEASDMVRFFRFGDAAITGIVDAPPFARDAGLQGSMRVSILAERAIRYQFCFQNDDEERFVLQGAKSIRWFRPLRSFTVLEATLTRERDAVQLGTATIRFDLGGLVPFLKSWRPWDSFTRLDLSAPSEDLRQADAALSPSERATLRALTEATLAQGSCTPAASSETVAAAEHIILRCPAFFVEGYRWALRWLDSASLLRYRRRFRRLAPELREQLLESLISGHDSGWREILAARIAALLVTPIKTAHFGRSDYLAAIAHPDTLPPPTAEAPPRYLAQITSAEELEAETDLEVDVVVVGTGAGGAPIARQLASQGLAVAIVEEGRFKQRHDFTGSPIERIDALWRERGMFVSFPSTVVIPTGRVVGGTTTINSGTCFATPDPVLESWRRELGFPDGFAPDQFHRYTHTIQKILDVAPGSPEAVGRIADVIARGAGAMGLQHGPLPRNAPGCTGAGACIFGCPEGAKRSTDVAFIPAALEAGAVLFTGLGVRRILTRGPRAVGVLARGTDQHGVAKSLTIRARHVVVACGTLLSPLLLEASGIRLPRLGRNLSVHLGLGMFARVDQALEPWRTIPQGYGIEGHGIEGVRYEGFYLPPQLASSFVPFVGHELARWMDDFGRLAQFGFMVRDENRGQVRRGPGGRPLIQYKISARSLERIQRGKALLAELFFHAGATEVLTGIASQPIVRSLAAARALAEARISSRDLLPLGAHPLGTCAMGACAESSVVDFENRVHGYENLYVADGSTVPTSLGVNPQVTIMSLSLRAADKILSREAAAVCV